MSRCILIAEESLGRLQLELILTAATLCVAIVGVISGLFGMNLHNTHEESYPTFVLVRLPLDPPSSALYTITFRTSSHQCSRLL